MLVPVRGVSEAHVWFVESLEAHVVAEIVDVSQSVCCGRTEGHKESGLWPSALKATPHQH